MSDETPQPTEIPLPPETPVPPPPSLAEEAPPPPPEPVQEEKPKATRATARKNTKLAPEVVEEESAPKPKAKGKPRAKTLPTPPIVIDAVELESTQTEAPPPPESEPLRASNEPAFMSASTALDTRTPQQRLADMQVEMKRLKREAKNVLYKKMLEGKI